jgi:hypothetical protein
MGYYGVGVLWCVRGRGLGTFITFNNERIARREPDGTWFILKTGWEVTPVAMAEVHVQLNGHRWRHRGLPRRKQQMMHRALYARRKSATMPPCPRPSSLSSWLPCCASPCWQLGPPAVGRLTLKAERSVGRKSEFASDLGDGPTLNRPNKRTWRTSHSRP